nr:hypothetical protein [Tanacetum cinerariifolium]
MADNRTMAQRLQAPIEGYEDAIVVPPINANNFELKQTLINLVQSNQFTERQDPHNHLRFFNKVTSTFRHPEVPNTTVKLLLFSFSLEGETRIWLDKEPPRSILTWEDLVSKFINQFFPPSKTTYLRNEITNFLQKSNETFNEAWERFKDLLHQCPHHGFSKLHQLDTLSIIESKSKVRYSRSRVTDTAAVGNFIQNRQDVSNQMREGYHVVPPPYTGTFMPPKLDLVFHDAPNVTKTVHVAFNVELSPTKPEKVLSQSNRSTAPIIEDWVSDSEDEFEAEPTLTVPSFVQPIEPVKTPRSSVKTVEHPIPAETHRKASPKTRDHRSCKNRKACFVCKSLTHLIKDCDYYEKQMVQQPVRNHVRRGTNQHYASLNNSQPHRHVVPTTILTKSRLVPLTAARPVNAVVSQPHVTRPRPVKNVVTKSHSPPRRTINRRPYPKPSTFPQKVTTAKALQGNPHHTLQDKGVIDSGCSKYMTENMSYLSNFESINGGYVAYGGNPKGGKITGKCKIRTGKLDFDDVYFVKELKFNLFSVSQMCDKKNNVLFTDTECIVLSSDFKLPDESHGKQHRASCKTKPVSSICQSLQRLHMDLFGPTFVKSLNKKRNYLVVTDDYSRFSWVFFLATKDETSPIFKTFITGIENQLSLTGKIIRSDNGTEFKNHDLNQFYGMKGINREFSVARTPQQNGIAERKNMTLIEAARTMLADSLLPIPFWAEAVNTACYVQNKVLVTKPHNKNPYELLHGRTPSIGFMRPFGCLVTILNTLDPLGKFDGKVYEGFLVGYSVSSKAFRVFNSRTRIVQETLHINFLENKPNVAGSGPTWLFDIDTLTKSMNYQPVSAGNQPNPSVGVQDHFDAEKAEEENVQQYVLFFSWSSGSNDPQNTDDDTTFKVKENEFKVEKPESEVHVSLNSSAKTKKHDDKTKREDKGKNNVELSTGVRKLIEEIKNFTDNSTNEVNAISTLVHAVGQNSTNSTNTFSAAGPSNTTISPTLGESSYMDHSQYPDDPDMLALGDITYSDDDEEDVGVEADFTNLETTIIVNESGLTQINTDDFHTCMFACFLSQEEPKRAHQALKDPGWIEAMQEELLQFKMQKVWVLVDLPKGKRAIDLCKAFEKLMKDKFLMSSIGELTFFLGLQVKQKPDGIFICQDRYVAEILRKFRVTDGKLASTPIDNEKPLLKDSDGKDVDVHTYRYLKGKPHLDLWYPKDSPFNLVAYSDSDYVGASLDRKYTTGGCQFLGCRLISWQCKKQTVVTTSSTEA